MKKLFLLAFLPLMFIACDKDIDPNLAGANELHYTTNNNEMISFDKEDFDAEVTSHTYDAGSGVIIFSKPITKIGDYAFQYAKLVSISIPNKVATIGEDAFYGCDYLESVVFGNSIKCIGRNCFYSCNLTSVSLNEGLEKIEYGAFCGCDKLHTITLPSSLIAMESNIFSGCYALESIYCKASNPPSTENDTFYGIRTYPVVYVPQSHLWKYQSDSNWSKMDLEGYDF